MNQAGVLMKRFSLPAKALVFLAIGILLVGWLLNTPEGLLGKADAVGYAVCHRIDVRSFHLGARQVPLCARCSGMYLGAMLGLIYMAGVSSRKSMMPHWKVMVIFGLFVIAFGVDGVNSYLHLFPKSFAFPSLYEPNNGLRLLTGTGMGLVMAGVLFPAFNQTVWRESKNGPVLTWRSFLPLALLALILDAIVLTENPLVLYPLALISAGGVLILLSIVYTMVWMIILRLENQATRWTQILLPLTGGFGMALLQIVILDLIRFTFTGTWDGFHLG